MQGVPRGVPPRVRGGTPWGTPADPEGYPMGYPRGPWGVPLGVPQTPQRVPRADPTQPCGVPPGVAHARGYPPRTLPCVVPYPAGYPFWGYPRGYPQKGPLGHRAGKKKKIFFFFLQAKKNVFAKKCGIFLFAELFSGSRHGVIRHRMVSNYKVPPALPDRPSRVCLRHWMLGVPPLV